MILDLEPGHPDRGAGVPCGDSASVAGRWRRIRTAHRAGTVVFAAVLASGAVSAEPLSEVIEHGWRGFAASTTLGDGSVLSEYGAATTARGDEQVELRVAFSPRFECSPMISLSLAADMAARLDASDGKLLALTIDDGPVVWPVLVDRVAGDLVVSLRGNERERSTLRLRIDVGEFAVLALDDGQAMTFSLLGSRRSLAAVESRCLEHVAIPWEGG